MSEGRKHPLGYVLAMTLLLLAMAGTALTAVASHSHRRAIAAVRAQEGLQRRWGGITCADALLPRAPQLVEAIRQRPRAEAETAPDRGAFALQLGGQTFVVSAYDEQAKVNLNTLTSRLGGGGAGFEGAVRAVMGKDAPALRLLPKRVTETDEAGKQHERMEFASYGQVFGDAPAAVLMGRGKSPGLAAAVTCWGDGRLNVEHASPAAVAGLCATVLEPKEFEKFRRAQERAPTRKWDQLFMELKFMPEREKAMKELITTTSSCHTLWVVADATGRPAYRMAVIGSAADGEGSVETFEW